MTAQASPSAPQTSNLVNVSIATNMAMTIFRDSIPAFTSKQVDSVLAGYGYKRCKVAEATNMFMVGVNREECIAQKSYWIRKA